MNCGIYCVKELLNDLGIDSVVDIKESDLGISVYDIVSFLNKKGLEYQAFYSKKPVLQAHSILYDKINKHYYYLKGYDKYFVYLSDVNHQKIIIFKCFYPFIYTKYIIKMV